jgi:hypothetical protein
MGGRSVILTCQGLDSFDNALTDQLDQTTLHELYEVSNVVKTNYDEFEFFKGTDFATLS